MTLSSPREILERGDVAAVEAVAALDHHALTIVQLGEPHPHPCLDLRVVQQKFRRQRVLVGDAVGDRHAAVAIHRRIERGQCSL